MGSISPQDIVFSCDFWPRISYAEVFLRASSTTSFLSLFMRILAGKKSGQDVRYWFFFGFGVFFGVLVNGVLNDFVQDFEVGAVLSRNTI